MRLPHHLLRHPSGIFHFRLVVPADLRQVLGKKIIKVSLRTRDPVEARAYAYALGARYAHAISEARGGHMGNRTNDYLSRISKFEITPQPDGRYALKTDGSQQDNDAGLRALAMLTAAPVTPPASAAPTPPSPALLADVHQQLLAAFSTPPTPKGPTLQEAFDLYVEVEVRNLKKDTWQQRERAMRSFVSHVGGYVRVDEVTRPVAAQWASDLQKSGLTKRYVANMVSHAAQLFAAQIRSGHVPHGQNPVKGVVTLSTADKRAIRSSGRGWEPFELDTLKLIYAPENLARTTQQHTRWAALMGLYSGARVGELAQLYLRDFADIHGVKCFRISDDNDGQSVKNASSRRLVPIHPDLLELGLWDRVERLRAQGQERLFPDLQMDVKGGPGNAVTNGFSYLLKSLKVKPRRASATVGFHSLRKTVIQQLQGTALPEERRRALVGHEDGSDDVHRTVYMREWHAEEVAAFFPGLPWAEWLNIPALKSLLS
jgi:integrase